MKIGNTKIHKLQVFMSFYLKRIELVENYS